MKQNNFVKKKKKSEFEGTRQYIIQINLFSTLWFKRVKTLLIWDHNFKKLEQKKNLVFSVNRYYYHRLHNSQLWRLEYIISD